MLLYGSQARVSYYCVAARWIVATIRFRRSICLDSREIRALVSRCPAARSTRKHASPTTVSLCGKVFGSSEHFSPRAGLSTRYLPTTVSLCDVWARAWIAGTKKPRSSIEERGFNVRRYALARVRFALAIGATLVAPLLASAIALRSCRALAAAITALRKAATAALASVGVTLA